MLQDTAIIMYSHSSYADAWPMFVGQQEKYFPELKKYVFTDSVPCELPSSWEVIYYKEEMSYNERFSSCLESVSEEYSILHHEDMPLFSAPDKNRIESYLKCLNEDNNLAYCKLLKGGEMREIPYKKNPELFAILHDSEYIFAVQPTIWKTAALMTVYTETKVSHIREFEPKSQETCRKNSIHGVYAYRGEPKRGMYHHDSSVYPYVATAIVRGQWNYSEYSLILDELLYEYGINPQIRGIA